jgi:general secretion pathway protein K
MTALNRLVRARSGRDGFIVVAVLWILVALATLATVYAVYVRNTAAALLVHDERVQAEGLVTAAVELVVYRMTAIPSTAPTRGNFTFRAGRTSVAVDFRAENARIDLNAAPKELLAGLFTTLGARAEMADFYADRIVAWRSAPKPESLDDEMSAYKAAGLRYGPRFGPFPHPGELSLVLGIPPALVERAMPLVTVYSGQASINLADARPEVVAALPGMTPDRLHDLLALRQAPQQNAADALAALGPARGMATTAGSKGIRVAVRIVFENGRQTGSEVVIVLTESGNEPYSVLSWRDDVDDVPQDPPPRTSRR